MNRPSLLISFSFLLIAFVIVMSFLFSCKKESNTGANLFYGRWKTSYGDTIDFSVINGRNVVIYDASMSPAPPITAVMRTEYDYRNNKLGLKNGMAGTHGYYYLSSFRWLDYGQSFELQGVEWFPFMSSTSTFFTFTKIP